MTNIELSTEYVVFSPGALIPCTAVVENGELISVSVKGGEVTTHSCVLESCYRASRAAVDAAKAPPPWGKCVQILGVVIEGEIVIVTTTEAVERGLGEVNVPRFNPAFSGIPPSSLTATVQSETL